MEEDLDKLKELVKKKKGSQQCNEQEIVQGRRIVKNLERDVDELTDCKMKLTEEIENERDIQGQI